VFKPWFSRTWVKSTGWGFESLSPLL